MDKTKGLFLPEDENLREKGDWSQFTLWQQGELLTSRLFSAACPSSEVDPSLVTRPRARVPQFMGNCPENTRLSNSIHCFSKLHVNTCTCTCVYTHVCIGINICNRILIFLVFSVKYVAKSNSTVSA